VGPAHDEPERERDDDDDAKGDDPRHGEKGRADLNDVEGVGQVDGTGVGTKAVEQGILDDDCETESDQEDIAVLAVCGRPDDETLQHIAETEKYRGQANGRDIGIDAKPVEGKEG